MNLSSSSSDTTVFLEDRVLGFDPCVVLPLGVMRVDAATPVIGVSSIGWACVGTIGGVSMEVGA